MNFYLKNSTIRSMIERVKTKSTRIIFSFTVSINERFLYYPLVRTINRGSNRLNK